MPPSFRPGFCLDIRCQLKGIAAVVEVLVSLQFCDGGVGDEREDDFVGACGDGCGREDVTDDNGARDNGADPVGCVGIAKENGFGIVADGGQDGLSDIEEAGPGGGDDHEDFGADGEIAGERVGDGASLNGHDLDGGGQECADFGLLAGDGYEDGVVR